MPIITIRTGQSLEKEKLRYPRLDSHIQRPMRIIIIPFMIFDNITPPFKMHKAQEHWNPGILEHLFTFL